MAVTCVNSMHVFIVCMYSQCTCIYSVHEFSYACIQCAFNRSMRTTFWLHALSAYLHCLTACTFWLHALSDCMHCLTACNVWLYLYCLCRSIHVFAVCMCPQYACIHSVHVFIVCMYSQDAYVKNCACTHSMYVYVCIHSMFTVRMYANTAVQHWCF